MPVKRLDFSEPRGCQYVGVEAVAGEFLTVKQRESANNILKVEVGCVSVADGAQDKVEVVDFLHSTFSYF